MTDERLDTFSAPHLPAKALCAGRPYLLAALAARVGIWDGAKFLVPLTGDHEEGRPHVGELRHIELSRDGARPLFEVAMPAESAFEAVIAALDGQWSEQAYIEATVHLRM